MIGSKIEKTILAEHDELEAKEGIEILDACESDPSRFAGMAEEIANYPAAPFGDRDLE
ncbi:MAG: hypothetical protein OEM82_00750 [Acidobacteriota bacterium]|nr:hypothetical protein [Acidobacteriota bacterium]MDH3528766.1 hypothetical protein [Acidobacteriota bacterium]